VVRAHPTVPLFNDLEVFAARVLTRRKLRPSLKPGVQNDIFGTSRARFVRDA
jgi:hypothetical protein